MTKTLKHGQAGKPEYKVWTIMKDKCLNTRSTHYPNFGGRGIKVYEPWVHDFPAFFAYIGLKPSPKHRLERYPNREGNYEPGNLRWSGGADAVNVGDPILQAAPSPKSLSLIGRTFGKLQVTGIQNVRLGNGKLHAKALCKCVCGSIKEIFWTTVAKGLALSCGCSRNFDATTGSNNYHFKGYREIRSAFWRGYQNGAKDRGHLFELDIKYAWDLFEKQERKCAFSGVPLVFGSNKKNSATTASIDRIDPTKGYLPGNIQWVHKTINLMRNVLSVEDFISWCNLVAQRTRGF